MAAMRLCRCVCHPLLATLLSPGGFDVSSTRGSSRPLYRCPGHRTRAVAQLSGRGHSPDQGREAEPHGSGAASEWEAGSVRRVDDQRLAARGDRETVSRHRRSRRPGRRSARLYQVLPERLRRLQERGRSDQAGRAAGLPRAREEPGQGQPHLALSAGRNPDGRSAARAATIHPSAEPAGRSSTKASTRSA